MVLSQTEIDALLSSKPADETPPPPEEPEESAEEGKASSPKSRTPMPPPDAEKRISAIRLPAQPSDSQPDSLQGLLPELMQRLEQVEAATKGFGSLEKGIADLTSTVQTLLQNYQTLTQHLQSQSTHVQGIADNSKATPGYGLRKSFKCNRCASQGTVASRVKCTSCGNENWWGWFPKK